VPLLSRQNAIPARPFALRNWELSSVARLVFARRREWIGAGIGVAHEYSRM